MKSSLPLSAAVVLSARVKGLKAVIAAVVTHQKTQSRGESRPEFGPL